MTQAPDDLPGEADFRAEFGPYMEALQEMWLEEAIRLQARDYVETRRMVGLGLLHEPRLTFEALLPNISSAARAAPLMQKPLGGIPRPNPTE